MHAQVPNERVKTPTVLQMEASECGAASLGIVLGYYRYFVPLEELRLACDVTRDGSKASNILKAARQYGLIAKGLRQELSNLPRLKLPLIVHWNFNHFLVVEGFKGDKVYLNDPAIGPRVVTRAEFDQAFTGVALTFALGPEFRPGGNKHSLVKALRQRLRGSETALGYIVFAGLALVVPGLIIPAFTRVFVDDILAKGLDGWVKPLLLGMGLVLLLNAVLTWLREHYLLRLQTKLAMSTSSRFLWHVLRLPIQFFMQRYAGEIGGRVALNDEVARLLSGELAVRAISLMTVVFFALVMFQYDVGLTLIGILIVALNMIALYYFSGKRRDEQQPLLQERGKLVGTAMSGLRTIESIKASGTEADFFTRWAGYQAKTLNAKGSLSIYTRLLINIPAFLAGVNTAAILGLGGLRVMTGQLSIGELVAFQALMASFVAPFTGLVNLSSQFQKVTGALNRLDDVLHHDLDAQFAQDNPGAEVDGSRLKLMGYLEIKNLSFGYSRLVPALIEDFSLSLKPGSRVALVGDTGSGKSTIARVVAGLYAPWSGQILFDGQSRADLPRSLINNSLALVDQDIFLFEGTVRENITLWDPLIPETDIIRAAKDAHIHDVIAARPSGYDSLIMEGGRNFSGGQRQRLEIARALALNPTLLILDEATSALDPTTEKIIDENIRRRGCSCLIIAHRLSTIRDCDEIIVLQQGRMVERGTHESMRRANGPYARLIQVGLTKEDGVQGQKAETLLADLAAKLKK